MGGKVAKTGWMGQAFGTSRLPKMGGGTLPLTKRPATQAVRRRVAGGFARGSRMHADDSAGISRAIRP